MRVPTFKHIGQDATDEGVISVLNSFMDFVFRAFRKNITIQENTPYSIVKLVVKTSGTYTIGDFDPLLIKIDPMRTVEGVVVLNCNPAGITQTPTWVQEGGNVRITWLHGLADNQTYAITLLIL